MFLKESWLAAICNAITSSLRDEKRDWYILAISRWDVYRMSKLRRLMALIRSIQHDSLRFLVQDSLASLAKLILDACHSVLHCPKDLTWGTDLISSPYKYVISHYPGYYLLNMFI